MDFQFFSSHPIEKKNKFSNRKTIRNSDIDRRISRYFHIFSKNAE